MSRVLEIGIVTDEITRDLGEALERAAGWGIQRFELREGAQARFPRFTAEEVGIMDRAIEAGAIVTAVSPGIFKGHVEEASQRQKEIESTFPKAIELAHRFNCPTIIAFSFDGCDESAGNRLKVLRAFEQIGEQAAAAGLVVAFENEPQFWIDQPAETVALLNEIGHPSLKINWDPANLHWSGMEPDEDAFVTLQPFLVNLHVKDFTPDDEEVPWRPLGDGIVPWELLLEMIVEKTNLEHVTVETHCEPLVSKSEKSVDVLRRMMA